MTLRINPRVLASTLKQLQTLRAAILVIALELVSLQGVLIASGKIAVGVAVSFIGCIFAGLYVLLAPELVLFAWDEKDQPKETAP